jgi:hypothetical protein
MPWLSDSLHVYACWCSPNTKQQCLADAGLHTAVGMPPGVHAVLVSVMTLLLHTKHCVGAVVVESVCICTQQHVYLCSL